MRELEIGGAFAGNFLGNTPSWYKLLILSYLIINPILFVTAGPFVTGWVLIAEFISTLALALKCYPLPSGGLLAIEAVILGMTSPGAVYEEVLQNLPVILLLMFMVAGIYFMKEFLLFIFTKLLLGIKSKLALSLIFCFMGAFLSAFLDALTVTAVIITVAYGFYGIYHKYASCKTAQLEKKVSDDSGIGQDDRSDLENFRGFLRNLMMHAAVGTALGGALTLVGEPQNLLIGKKMGWDFITFFIECSRVSIPVFISGFVACFLVETTHILGYGYKMPENVRKVLEANEAKNAAAMNSKTVARYIAEGAAGVLLIFALAFHVAEVGLIGLGVIILISSFTGMTEEHSFGQAFTESLPFTALLVVFFTIVAVINQQELFKPLLNVVLEMEGQKQLLAFFAANGVLSSISDNVFVATIYITEVKNAFDAGLISADQFAKLAVATNMGTNIPSVATPNGQAAFLFLLTSALAPVIRLSYVEMLKLALPYTVIMTSVGLLATYYFL